MANPYINIYKDNPTAGAKDGTAVTMGNSYTAPIKFTLDAEQNESAIQKCAIRTETGYVAQVVTISDLNDSDDRWKVCKTEDGTFEDSITFDEVTDTNSIFYVKATSASTEQPMTDRSVKLRYSGKLLIAG